MHIYLVDEKNTYRRGKLPEVCSFDTEFFSLTKHIFSPLSLLRFTSIFEISHWIISYLSFPLFHILKISTLAL